MFQHFDHVTVKQSSTSKHAGKTGECRNLIWKNSTRYWKLKFADGTMAKISENMLEESDQETFEKEKALFNERQNSARFMVLTADKSVFGPYTERGAEAVATELMMNDAANECIILQAIKSCAQPRTVVEFKPI